MPVKIDRKSVECELSSFPLPVSGQGTPPSKTGMEKRQQCRQSSMLLNVDLFSPALQILSATALTLLSISISLNQRQGCQSTHLARTSTSESSVFGGHEIDSFPHCHPKQQMNSTSICEQIRATRIPCSASRDLLAHTPSLCKDDNYNNRVINTDVKQNILSAAAVQKRVIM